MTTIHVFVQVLFIFTLRKKSIFHALSYNLFSPILLENCFSPILYVITEVLQALRMSYHQKLNRKTDTLLLNAFSREARECKCCLYRFMYQRTENHTCKTHKNTISSFGLLPPQWRRALLEVNFFKTQIFTNICFTVQWLYSNFHNTHKSKYQDHYIYHELRDIHLVSAQTDAFLDLKYVRLYGQQVLFKDLLYSCHSMFFSCYFFSWSFSASRSAERIPSFFSSSTRSPFWCIWRSISQPPTNSPLRYTCGMVGQLE